MSEILIKGMEMPEGCYYCPILIGKANCSCAITGTQIRIEKVREELEDERMSDCPLVELPPHGALKDERYVLNEIDRQFGENEKTSDIAQDIQSLIMSAPTILEATE